MREMHSWLRGLLDNVSLLLGTALAQWWIVRRSVGAGGALLEKENDVFPLLSWPNSGWGFFFSWCKTEQPPCSFVLYLEVVWPMTRENVKVQWMHLSVGAVVLRQFGWDWHLGKDQLVTAAGQEHTPRRRSKRHFGGWNLSWPKHFSPDSTVSSPPCALQWIDTGNKLVFDHLNLLGGRGTMVWSYAIFWQRVSVWCHQD